jgi:hypothetical protein
MTALEQALLELDGTLANNGIPYMIIGGMANAVWGEPRATLDIDVTVWVEKEDISHIVSLLASLYQPRVSDPASFVEETRVLPLDSEEGVPIDVIFGTLPFEQQAIARSVEVPVAGTPVRFCTPEDLILHKIVSERETDLQDARSIVLRRLRLLDLPYLEPKIRELSDSLDRPELWHAWNQWKKESLSLQE